VIRRPSGVSEVRYLRQEGFNSLHVFDMVTIPTLVQRRAFDLLGVNLTV
jgi:hypothetical protein